MAMLARNHEENVYLVRLLRRGTVLSVTMVAWLAALVPHAIASHQGHDRHGEGEIHEIAGPAYSIPGASFQVFLGEAKGTAEGGALDDAQANAAVQTVIEAFTIMLDHGTDYPRFHESLKKDALQQVIIEPKVINQEGKEFSFLVARTKDPGRVKLLISASSLKEKGYLGHPDKLVPCSGPRVPMGHQ